MKSDITYNSTDRFQSLELNHRTFSHDTFSESPQDIKVFLEEELSGLTDESIPGFIELVTEEFDTIDSSDELNEVQEVVESYKKAIINGDTTFYWSYTAPINKLSKYIIKGKNIIKL